MAHVVITVTKGLPWRVEYGSLLVPVGWPETGLSAHVGAALYYALTACKNRNIQIRDLQVAAADYETEN